VRVVLLSKRHPLTEHLERQLESAGVLAGVVYEQRLVTPRERFEYFRKWAKKQGWLRIADQIAYEIYERIMRQGDLRRARALLPVPADEPRPDVPRHEVTNLNAPESRALIASLAPDVLVVHATGILKPETFGLARVCAMNVHCGVLPEYRGHASTFWSFSRGDLGNVGVTIHLVAPRVDTGGILRIGRVHVQRGDDDISLWYKAFMLGADLVVDVVRGLARGGEVHELSLPGAMGPHYPRKGLTDYLGLRARTAFGRLPRPAAVAVRSEHA
jgi:methionyl-tRNA formyltransferase